MSEAFDPRKSTTAFDQASTLVLILELSGKSWRAAASVPGLSRRPMRNLAAYGVGAVLEAIERWKGEAKKAGCEVGRVVAGYEAGLDGFWIARALMARAKRRRTCANRGDSARP
jgi:transposase